jgi:DeoR/GlpR family transcriptional regulator of sugar metabolism
MCRKVEVRLELSTAQDIDVLRTNGLAALRRRRISRLARQARVQGALLTVEDLGYLLTSSPATIKRDLAVLRDEGESVPTRGQVRDIGPSLSHKATVV